MKYKKMSPKHKAYILASFLLSLILTLKLIAFAASPDAIAVRVISNPKHLSALSWYKAQGFKGAPQTMVVDGYNAIRDGRTVYVNAGNLAGGELYTNIYLISYNQTAEAMTEDIFSHLLLHWKFNANLLDPPGTCEKTPAQNCLLDSDCGQNDFCGSGKAMITRDCLRLEGIADIRDLLESYREKNGFYPKLVAGSYLLNYTMSVWPSWEGQFAKMLGQTLPIDPVNRLGACPASYNPITGWDEKAKKFAEPVPDPDPKKLNLPAGSNVYLYAGSALGTEYDLCAVMESGFVTGVSDGACSESAITKIVSGDISNHVPEFVNANFPSGLSGEPYTGLVEGYDADGDPLSWTVDILSAGQWVTWSSAPVMKDDLSMPLHKTLAAAKAGMEDTYSLRLSISDGKAITSKIFEIKVYNDPPGMSGAGITAPDITIVASSTNPLEYVLSATDKPSNYPLYEFSITPLSPAFFPANWISETEVLDTATQTYSKRLHGYLNPASVSVPSTVYYSYKVRVEDAYHAATSSSFKITVINHPPAMDDPACPASFKRHGTYACKVSATDEDNNKIRSYSLSFSSPALSGLTVSPSGQITGTAVTMGKYTVNVTATDEFGAVSAAKSFPVEVLSDCESQTIAFDGAGYTMDAMVLDDNQNTNSAVDKLGGTDLKLSGVMPTPYIWIAHSTRNEVAKIRTFDGYKRDCARDVSGKVDCWWDYGVIETRGQVIGVYPTAAPPPALGNPSRTAVNVETGDAWVANRGGTYGDGSGVVKFDINGVMKKNCTSADFVGARGVVIDKSGDVWVANYFADTVVKISGDDKDCTIKKTVHVPYYVTLNPADGTYFTIGNYGMAIDSQNNLWVNNRGGAGLVKIDTNTGAMTTAVNGLDVAYGITVDLNDNVWMGKFSGTTAADSGVYKYDLASGLLFYPIGYVTTGIAIDINGGVWASGYNNASVFKIRQNDGALIYNLPSGGSFPHGICGDSSGQVWSVNLGDMVTDYLNMARVFDSSSGAVNVDYVSVSNPYTPAESPYTYSDMTGLNRAMLMRSSVWRRSLDGAYNDRYWGKIENQQITPAETSIDFEIKASNDVNFSGAISYTKAAWNSLPVESRSGRYIQVKIIMRSQERGITPVLWDLKLACP